MVYVAVSAPSLAEAEVFSEAFMIMGLEKAAEYYELNEETQVQSFMFYSDEQVLRNASTEDFDALLIFPDSVPQ
jgi:thiamine biosynthesis lipoprotein ApbE